MKRMYVIKKGGRYVADADKDDSFTQNIDKAYMWTGRKAAQVESFPDKGEVVVKVTTNKHGKLVEAY